jgi:hypothetical protein
MCGVESDRIRAFRNRRAVSPIRTDAGFDGPVWLLREPVTIAAVRSLLSAVRGALKLEVVIMASSRV